ncbi:putative ORFan [Tupanvirus deep ocean]|uniref:ORFan n=2 Tax=Tupanvirus TaxID=2094720 RepID=A0AC62AA26_9VIRU|nr:putative ORFan [Tupanvirus deep ocean]QKU34500.1 putative ORFan [Tupanvirus deep ocean]
MDPNRCFCKYEDDDDNELSHKYSDKCYFKKNKWQKKVPFKNSTNKCGIQYDFNTSCNKNKPKCEKENCGEIIKISKEDLPFRIQEAGNYCLTENITHTDLVNAAIIIEVSDVQLDMAHHYIDLLNTGAQAISIRNASRVSIQNGTIKNVTFNSQLLEDISIPPFSNVYTLPNIKLAAIRADNVNLLYISNMVVENAPYGFVITNAGNNIVINNIRMNRIGTTIAVPVNNTTVNEPLGAGIVVGGRSDSLRARDVLVEDVVLSSDNAKFGILLVFINSFVVVRTMASSGRFISVPPTLLANVGSVAIMDCSYGSVVSSHLHSGIQPIFTIRAYSINIEDIKMVDTLSDGVQLTFSDHITIRNCETQRSNASPDLLEAGSGYKLYVCNCCIIEDSIATGFTTGETGPNGVGITLSACNNCTIVDNITTCNNIGIQELLTFSADRIYFGTPSTYYRNISHSNNILNYQNIEDQVINTIGVPVNTPVVPWVNLEKNLLQ